MNYVWNTLPVFERVFDDVMGPSLGSSFARPSRGLTRVASAQSTWLPATDWHQTDNEIVLTCDVPGLKRDQLDITLENRVLTVSGSRRAERPEGSRGLVERTFGSFTRSFALPDTVDDENVSADLTDGVLSIRLPRQAKSLPKKIAIGGAVNAELSR